jgi:hypothetical protein
MFVAMYAFYLHSYTQSLVLLWIDYNYYYKADNTKLVVLLYNLVKRYQPRWKSK